MSKSDASAPDSDQVKRVAKIDVATRDGGHRRLFSGTASRNGLPLLEVITDRIVDAVQLHRDVLHGAAAEGCR